jgi:hypothetical protein
MARREPALKVEPRLVGGVGAGESTGGEAQAPRLLPYCFVKGLVLNHAAPVHRARQFS